jgi:hypothetical protein
MRIGLAEGEGMGVGAVEVHRGPNLLRFDRHGVVLGIVEEVMSLSSNSLSSSSS